MREYVDQIKPVFWCILQILHLHFQGNNLKLPQEGGFKRHTYGSKDIHLNSRATTAYILQEFGGQNQVFIWHYFY